MRYLLKNATVWLDRNHCDPLHILVEGSKIIAVTKDEIEVPAHTVDLSGYMVMPGWIHTHLHMFDCFHGFDEKKLAKWLQAGFTTIRDQGILSRHTTEEVISWRNQYRHSVMHPTLAVCGKYLSSPNGYGGVDPWGVASVGEARQAVKELVEAGVDHIKTTLDAGYDSNTQSLDLLSLDILTAICEEAHRLGRKVSAHVNRHDDLKILLQAGIDEAAHACFDSISDETLAYMVQHQVAMTPTLSVYGEITNLYGAPFLDAAMDNVKRFVEIGGVLGFGNDYIEEKAVWSECGMPYMEISLLLKAGLTMHDVIHAATRGGAAILGRDNLGKVEAGCIADLIAVKGNPIQFPYLMTHVPFVMKDGIIAKQE